MSSGDRPIENHFLRFLLDEGANVEQKPSVAHPHLVVEVAKDDGLSTLVAVAFDPASLTNRELQNQAYQIHEIGTPVALIDQIVDRDLAMRLFSCGWSFFASETAYDIRAYQLTMRSTEKIFSDKSSPDEVETDPSRVDRFWRSFAQYLNDHSDQRVGQALFNTLAQLNAHLAESITGGAMDPFHNDDRIPQFINIVTGALTRDDKHQQRQVQSSGNVPIQVKLCPTGGHFVFAHHDRCPDDGSDLSDVEPTSAE